MLAYDAHKDDAIRRPRSMKPPPMPEAYYYPRLSVPVKLPELRDQKMERVYGFFTGQLLSEAAAFRVLVDYVFGKAESSAEVGAMVRYLLHMSLECSVNAVPICKALYVITQNDSAGPVIRRAFFGELENMFKTRIERIFLAEDGVRKFRNFIQLMMAAVHHCRNVKVAPIHELVVSLVDLSDDIAHFKYFEDVTTYAQLILRVLHYSGQPSTFARKRTAESQEVRQKWADGVFRKARKIARMTLSSDPRLPPINRKWLTLLLEATRLPTKLESNKNLVKEYESLPGFDKFLPTALKIKLPTDFHVHSFQISHIFDLVELCTESI